MAQVEDGTVARFRTLYGPREKAPRKEDQEKTPDHWENIKSTVTRRERLYKALTEEFAGDSDYFYAFFAGIVPSSDVVKKVMPRCKKWVEKEKSKPQYFVDGVFCNEKWTERWGDQNDYKVYKAVHGGLD